MSEYKTLITDNNLSLIGLQLQLNSDELHDIVKMCNNERQRLGKAGKKKVKEVVVRLDGQEISMPIAEFKRRLGFKESPPFTLLEALASFQEEFLIDNVPRDERLAQRFNITPKQVYAHWKKLKIDEIYVNWGTSLRSGWLTDEGVTKLAELRAELEAINV